MQRGKRGVVLMQLTVFAAIAGTRPDEGSCELVDHLWCRPEQLPCLPLQNGDKLIRSYVALIFCAFWNREFSLRRFCRQFLDPLLQRRIRAKVHHCIRLVLQDNLQKRTNSTLKCC